MPDRVLAFINRQRGDANHAAMRAGILKRLAYSCLDNSSVEANNNAIRNIKRAYEKQARAEQKAARKKQR